MLKHSLYVHHLLSHFQFHSINLDFDYHAEHIYSKIVDADMYINYVVDMLGNVKEREFPQGDGIMREFVEQCDGYRRYHDFEITYEFKEELFFFSRQDHPLK